MPPKQCCKQLPLKKDRAAKHHVVTDSDRASITADFFALSENRSGGGKEALYQASRRDSSSEQSFAKLDVSVNVSKSCVQIGANGSEMKYKQVLSEVAADDKTAKTDFHKVYYHAIGVAKAPTPTEKAEARRCNLELLGQVSLEQLKSDIEKAVTSGIRKTIAGQSKQAILSRSTSISSFTKSSNQLLSMNTLPQPSIERLKSLSSTKSNNLLRGLSDDSFRPMIESAGSSFDVFSMPTYDQSVALQPSRPPQITSNLGALVRDASSQIMVMTKSDDHSVTSRDLVLPPRELSNWLRDTSDSSAMSNDTAQKPNEVTNQVNGGGQTLDVNAFSTILAIAERNKKVTEMVTNREDVSSAKEKADAAAVGSQEKQYFKRTNRDVIFGRGTGPNTHNQFFREEVAKQREGYLAGHNAEQDAIVRRLFNFVQSEGKFLKQDMITKTWFEVKDKKVFSKIRQMIREYKTNEQEPSNLLRSRRKRQSRKIP